MSLRERRNLQSSEGEAALQCIPTGSDSARAAALDIPTTIIVPSTGWVSLRLRDLWTYRELLYFITWRDLKVRYKQAVLGGLWAILQPFLTMIVFTIFFGRLAKVPSEGVPYPIFAYVGLLPWQLFANAVSQSGSSLVSNQSLLTKVYFPRLAIPAASVLATLVDFAIAFVVLLGMMLYYGISPTVNVVALPLFILLAVATALGVGLWLAALNVQYRDVQYVIPFLVQLWLFASPVAYPTSLVPARWRVLYGLNPMAGVVEGFRWALLGHSSGPGPMLGVSAAVVAVLMFGGLVYFKRVERTLADLI